MLVEHRIHDVDKGFVTREQAVAAGWRYTAIETRNRELRGRGVFAVVGDVAPGAEVAYEVLCRRHHMRQVTARVSRAAHTSSLPLPFKE